MLVSDSSYTDAAPLKVRSYDQIVEYLRVGDHVCAPKLCQ